MIKGRDPKGRFKKGHKESNEVKEKRRKKLIGRKVTEETRKKIAESNRGKKHPPMNNKTKKKISTAVARAHQKDPSIGKRMGQSRIGVPRKNFVPLEEAQSLAKKLGLKSGLQWRTYWRTHKRPNNVPSEPQITYHISMGDFFETGFIATYKRVYRSFEDARRFVHSLKLKSGTWQDYCKSGKKPDDIPANPHKIYKKELKNMGDWLGTGNVATQNRVYRSFEDLRKFARSLKLKSGREWDEYWKKHDKPDDIPANPDIPYKKQATWVSWADFLGHSHKKGGWWSYEKARKYIQPFHLNNKKEMIKLKREGKLPDEFPSQPQSVYKNKGWTTWADFLGHSHKKGGWWSHEKAREFTRELGLKNYAEWIRYCKSGKKPDDIPNDPRSFYEKQGTWISLGDFLGTGYVAHQIRSANYLPMREALPIFRSLAKKYGLVSITDWKRFAKTHKNELEKLNIPASPWQSYTKERAWRKMKKK